MSTTTVANPESGFGFENNYDNGRGNPTEVDDNPESRNLNRREFLTYTFATMTTLLMTQAGMLTYSFLLPRFNAGDFGGKIDAGLLSDMPSLDAEPVPQVDGKFWLVNTAEGPKALYMVCTHLGCLYQWDTTERKFKCPCHGSCFDREGNYLGGPAGRSLDQFTVSVEENAVVVDTGTKVKGAANPSQLPPCDG